MKVLIVEDDVQLNIAISEFCKIKAFDTVSVKDGLTAIDQIDNGNFDLYIIDINIPRINGLDLLKHIRKTDLEYPGHHYNCFFGDTKFFHCLCKWV